MRGGFSNLLAVMFALTQLGEHILQRQRSELVQADVANQGIHYLQHPPVCSDGAGGVFCLPFQPAGGKFFKGHFAILCKTCFEVPLQFFGGVSDELGNAALWNAGWDLNCFCFADFFAVGSVAVADSDFISPFV